jgi:hypothetical protein
MNLETVPTLPFSLRATYHPSVKEIMPLGTRPPVAGAGFVGKLLERARQPVHDPELAYVLSVLAGWSYADGQTLSNKLRYYGLPLNTVHEIHVRNPAMLVIASAFFVRSECGRVGILSFRGTMPDDVINWFTDTDVTMRPISGGRVHAGFYANTEALWDDVSAYLAEAMGEAPWADGGAPPGDGQDAKGRDGQGKPRARMEKLYITGHSLGGAMAVLVAARISAGASPVPREHLAGVYTFGQPAVGDAAFASQCEEQFGDILYRHVFAYDVVPHLPPRSSGPFLHFGQERVTKSVHEPWAKPTAALAKQAPLIFATVLFTFASWAARRVDYLPKIHLPYSIDDHSPARYIEASRAAFAGA